MTIQEAIQAVKESAKADHGELRIIESLAIGEAFSQGDIYITRIDKLPEGCYETPERKLASGTSRGASHIVTGDVKCYKLENPSPLDSLITEAKVPWVLEHGEHAHAQFPAGIYPASRQQDFAYDEIKAVVD